MVTKQLKYLTFGVNMYTASELENDIRSLGIREGEVIFMHSSYKSLGELAGGAKTLFEVLLSVLGDEGTLVLPTFSYSTVTKENPYFNLNETPSCVGYLSNYFRCEVPGVMRSLHPTHSCAAIGRYTDFLLSSHECDRVMVGENSPLRKLPQVNGKVLFLGCSPARNTSMHGVEVLVNPPYLFHNSKESEYVLDDGKSRRACMMKRFTFTDTGTVQRYERLVPHLTDGELTRGKILDAECHLMDSGAIWRRGEQIMREDPFYFVDSPLNPKK